MKNITLYMVALSLCGLLFSCKAPVSQEKQVAFNEPHRPQFHFTPDSMWMNDPNGMVYFEGEYHLFFQHYPGDIVWGPMHWGHAVSRDLVHWEHLPIALYPDSLGYIFSGSAVIDWNNTSGLQRGKEPPMIAIFTHHNMEGERSGTNNFQYQSIAFSNDRGRSWTKYSGNPVLKNPGIRDFRDPKVIWYEKGGKWIMVFAAHDRVMLYSSADLIHWKRESEFGENTGAHGGVWECPDLFPLEYSGQEKWVLLVSINPGGPNGGSCTQYFVGEFDGKEFTNQNPGPEPLWLDYGKDNYAGVSFSDIDPEDGRRILIGWMSNWQYATRVPTEKWRSAMTLPRELSLGRENDAFLLMSRPVEELKVLREQPFELPSSMISGNFRIEGLETHENSMCEILLDFKLSNDSQFGVASEFGIRLSNGNNEELLIGYNTGEGYLYIDRRQSGIIDFSEEFGGIHKAPLLADDSGVLQLHVFIDKASAEVFANDGKRVMSEIFFPSEDFSELSLFAKNGSVKLKSCTIYGLKSIWN